MLRGKKRTEESVAFQLAPMIDMTFLLLIFFMVTTKISKEQIKMDIRLPTASNAVIPGELGERDIVSIDGDGRYFAGSRPVTEAEMLEHLRQRFRDFPPLRLYVRADANTPARQIKDLMRMAAEAGAIDVIFGSYQSE